MVDVVVVVLEVERMVSGTVVGFNEMNSSHVVTSEPQVSRRHVRKSCNNHVFGRCRNTPVHRSMKQMR